MDIDVDECDEALWPVAAVARRMGVAPATLRTWDRRYGIGPAMHRPGQRRLYSNADLTRLDFLRELLLQGVSVPEAARRVATATAPSPRPAGPRAAAGDPSWGALGAPSSAVTARQVREACCRLDAERVVDLLRHALADRGVVETWDAVVRPALAWLGERWQGNDRCIAAEHVLSDVATTLFRSKTLSRTGTDTRPVLLAGAPHEVHVLPLCALGAALAEQEIRSCLVGAAIPAPVLVEAVRRTKPSAVVVWSQTPRTADCAVLSAQPEIRSGHLVAAAGPGWDRSRLPERVESPADLAAAVALLTISGTVHPRVVAARKGHDHGER